MLTLSPEDKNTNVSHKKILSGELPIDQDETYLERRLERLKQAQSQITYEFTQDPGLLHQYYRLRVEMFISVWGLKHFSGEKDTFDDISQIMVARSGLQCIGGGRLTMSTPAHRQPLPMEKEDFLLKDLFTELQLSKHTYGEFSRLAILPEFRGGAVFPELASRFIRRAIAEGVDYAFNIAPLPLARSYRQSVAFLGLKWDIRNNINIPDREEYEGIPMVLSVMDLTNATYKISSDEIPHEDAAKELIS